MHWGSKGTGRPCFHPLDHRHCMILMHVNPPYNVIKCSAFLYPRYVLTIASHSVNLCHGVMHVASWNLCFLNLENFFSDNFNFRLFVEYKSYITIYLMSSLSNCIAMILQLCMFKAQDLMFSIRTSGIRNPAMSLWHTFRCLCIFKCWLWGWSTSLIYFSSKIIFKTVYKILKFWIQILRNFCSSSVTNCKVDVLKVFKFYCYISFFKQNKNFSILVNKMFAQPVS